MGSLNLSNLKANKDEILKLKEITEQSIETVSDSPSMAWDCHFGPHTNLWFTN